MSPRTRSSRKTRRSPRPNGRKKKSSDRAPRRAAATVLLGLGSNLGDSRARIETAITEIAKFARVHAISSLYRTDPVGHVDQPDFCNAVISIRWSGSPARLLATLQGLERRLGRRPTFPGGPREIDIDILDFGGAVRESPDPVLPHPRLAVRRFALAPIAEIAPDWKHPVSGRTARAMMRDLPKKPGARRVKAGL